MQSVQFYANLHTRTPPPPKKKEEEKKTWTEFLFAGGIS